MSCAFNSNKSNVSPAASIGTYSNLKNYNSGCGLNFNGFGISAPANASVRSGFYMVPNYGPPTYDALTSKEGSCSNGVGYFGIEDAYGFNSGQPCNQQYIQSGCGQGGQLGQVGWKCGDKKNTRGTCVNADDIDPAHPVDNETAGIYDKRWVGSPTACNQACGAVPRK